MSLPKTIKCFGCTAVLDVVPGSGMSVDPLVLYGTAYCSFCQQTFGVGPTSDEKKPQSSDIPILRHFGDYFDGQGRLHCPHQDKEAASPDNGSA